MSYTVKSLLAILFFVLIFRDFFRLLKRLKSTPNGKIKTAGICVLTVLSAAAAVILLTLFELSLLLVLLLAAWLFRKNLSAFAKNTLCKKNGKLKLAGVSAGAAFVLWFGLALFYRTDIGMPIGVKNYLYHKYGEEFEVSGFFGANVWGHPTNQLTCCPKNGNPQTDAFNVARKNTLSIGSRRFASDNYYGVLIRDDYKKFIETYLSDYFEEYEVDVGFNWSGLSNVKYMSDVFDKSTSLDKFLKFQKMNGKSCNVADVKITLPIKYSFVENIKESLLSFGEKISENTNLVFIDVYYINDSISINGCYMIINTDGYVKYYNA